MRCQAHRLAHQRRADSAHAGAHVFTVAELRYTRRGALAAEHAASYNWADDGRPRPLYHYVFAGEPTQPDSDEED